MTHARAACRPSAPGRTGPAAIAVATRGIAALLLAGAAVLALPARAAGPLLQFATSSPLDLPVTTPGEDTAGRPADGTPLYERAPMPNQNALEPHYDAGGASDPVQPSVIDRGSKVGESGGYSRNTSVNSAQDSRMKPGLGFALHVPTE